MYKARLLEVFTNCHVDINQKDLRALEKRLGERWYYHLTQCQTSLTSTVALRT